MKYIQKRIEPGVIIKKFDLCSMQGNGYLENQETVTIISAVMMKNTTNCSLFSICKFFKLFKTKN